MKSFWLSFVMIAAAAGILAVMAGCTAVSPFTYKDEGEDHINLEWKDYQLSTSRKIVEISNDIAAKHELTTQADAELQDNQNTAQQLLTAVGTASNVSGPAGPSAISLIGILAAALFQDNRRKDQKIAGIKVKREVLGSASADNDGADETDVQFNLTVNAAPAGGTFYVVGNVTELGNWNPLNAAVMQSISSTRWTAQVKLATGAAAEYKYVRMDSGKNFTWEGGSNRKITPTGDSLVVSDEWQ